jgi:large subunit ribosomal protein L10
MALTKAKKYEQVEKLGIKLQKADCAVIATFSKLPVSKDDELRKVIRGLGAQYQVVKNTLAERASKGTKLEKALAGMTGVTSIAYTDGDPVALAKAFAKFTKDNPEITVKAGLLEGNILSVKEVQALATMPSKEELYSKLLFLINAQIGRAHV